MILMLPNEQRKSVHGDDVTLDEFVIEHLRCALEHLNAAGLAVSEHGTKSSILYQDLLISMASINDIIQGRYEAMSASHA